MDLKSLWQYLIFAVLGLALWLIQDMIGEIREEVREVRKGQVELLRSSDNNTFRIRLLESRLEAVRSYYLRNSQPRHEDLLNGAPFEPPREPN